MMNAATRRRKFAAFKMSQLLVATSFIVLMIVFFRSESCEAESIVELHCRSGLNDIKSIMEFNQFIKEFSELPQEQLESKRSLKQCAKDFKAISDLNGLISTKDVCDMQKIDDLIDYHKKYFTVRKGLLSGNLNTPITYKLFTRYAVQVAFVCKSNLFKNLELARTELKDRSKVFEEAKELVYKNEPSIKSNIKLIEDQPDDPPTSNVKPQDQAELTLSEYREALTKLRQPEDILTFDTDDCKNHPRGKETLISDNWEKVQTFFKPALMCHQLHRYYAGSLLSIARLANYGYMAPHEDIDARISDSPMIRDWIVAVQVCEPMMHMKSSKRRADMIVVDTCSEKVSAIEPIVYEDSFEDLDNVLLDELVPRSEATRHKAQKIMKSTLKKMAKIDLMKQIKSGNLNKRSIFKKSILMAINKGGPRSRSRPEGHNNDAATATGSMPANLMGKFSHELTSGGQELLVGDRKARLSSSAELSDQEAYDTLMEVVANSSDEQMMQCPVSEVNDIDKPVSFDPLSSVASTVAVLAIMMVFEWVFFIVMTVAARICHELYFNFENLLTFPPKVLSWSDADFARYTDELDNMDEDDFFDYEELNPEERRQRELLAKVFGRPPPMLFKE